MYQPLLEQVAGAISSLLLKRQEMIEKLETLRDDPSAPATDSSIKGLMRVQAHGNHMSNLREVRSLAAALGAIAEAASFEALS